MRKILLSFFLLITITFAWAESPKRELRSAWVATVYRLNWPDSVITETGNALQINAQKKALTDILDSLVAVNMNAVYFQVRSMCDVMYKSSYEPWSTYLVATRGMDPGYDPFQFLIEEAHKRGIEVHAWINPYRYSTAVKAWSDSPDPLNYETSHPDWLLTYPATTSTAQNRILDPGNPAVIGQIKKIIGELVNNYDLDGVIFDDYFYVSGITDEDATSQQLYKPSAMSLADWRRSNVNSMVAAVYDTIQKIKPYVKFGVGPRGIWSTSSAAATKYGVKLPAGITGSDNYNAIYCDALAWLKEGTVDYVSPQLYWTTYSTGQDFDVLDPWWYDVICNKFHKHFYCSHSISNIDPSNYMPRKFTILNNKEVSASSFTETESALAPQAIASVSQEEIGAQIQRNRATVTNNAPGTVLYSAKYIYTIHGFMNYLRKFEFTQKSLTPAIDWKQHPSYGKVNNISISDNKLHWDKADENVRYSIYAIPNTFVTYPENYETSKYLLGTSYTNSFAIPSYMSANSYEFAVAVLDRYGNEFEPQIMTGINEADCKIACKVVSNKGNELVVNITSPEYINTYISLWSVSGIKLKQLLKQLSPGNNIISIPVEGFVKGIYIIKAESKKDNFVQKFLVK